MRQTSVQYDPAEALNPLEAALLQGIVDYYQDAALTEQIRDCRVVQREYSGCGFFTSLVVSVGSPLVIVRKDGFRFRNGNDIEAPELSHGAGSVLFIKDGLLHFLEVFAYVDGDPATLSSFALLPITPTTGTE